MNPPDCLTMPNTVREAEPSPLADILGGEERLEDLVHHPRAEYRFRYHRPPRGRNRLPAFPGSAMAPASAASTFAVRMTSLPRSGMASRAFTAEIDHHLLELVHIRLDRPEITPVAQIELDPLAEQAA